MEETAGTEMESMPGEGNSLDSDSNQDDTTGLVEEQGREGKRKEGKGDIRYQIYGKEYTENQSSMMLRVFAQVLKRHQDKVDRQSEQPLMNCASQINYKIQENPTEENAKLFQGM